MFTKILLIFGIIVLASAAYAGHKGAPWVPTWKKDMKRIREMLKLQAGERCVELGCGNGRISRDLAKTTDAKEIVGVELSLLQWLIAKLQSRMDGSFTKTSFVLGNAFKHDVSDYDAVYMFLMPETYAKIQNKLEKELKPGSQVVTYVWPIPGWMPTKIDKQEGSVDIYLYQRPL